LEHSFEKAGRSAGVVAAGGVRGEERVRKGGREERNRQRINVDFVDVGKLV